MDACTQPQKVVHNGVTVYGRGKESEMTEKELSSSSERRRCGDEQDIILLGL